jgi:protein gp37
LTIPLRWKRPKRIFVNSMGDLFHKDAPEAWVDRVFAVMALAPQHTFIVLTKRSARMREYLGTVGPDDAEDRIFRAQFHIAPASGHEVKDWPLPNVWLGVSCERQAEADERIPDLLATPAAVRFVSAEPLLGPVDFTNHDPTGIQAGMKAHGWSSIWRNNLIGRPWLDWIIVGAESGPHARPMELQWAGDILAQCKGAGVAAFMKQLSGPGGRAIKDIAKFPNGLRVREYPRAAS